MKKDSDIKKPWCVFGDMIWQNYGRIVRISDNKRVVYIQTSEQNTPIEWWNKSCYIKRFETLREAIIELYESDKKNRESCDPLAWYLENAELKFPGQLEKEERLKREIQNAEFYMIL